MTENNIALLIDADNFSANKAEELLLRLSSKGRVKIKRVYGDFGVPSLMNWRNRQLRCKFNYIQQFSKIGGNSTDMRLIIDAMDILHLNDDISIFCIASSDADYLPLVTRLQESGKRVIVSGGEFISNDMKEAADELMIVKYEKEEKKSSKMKIDEVLRTAYKNIGTEWCTKVKLGIEFSKLKKTLKNIEYPSGTSNKTVLKDALQLYPNMFKERGKGLSSELKLII